VGETMRKNTDALVRGGAARSSEEGPVMGVGQRGSASQSARGANHGSGMSEDVLAKAVRDTQDTGVAGIPESES
jgi:hypothetical protein